MSEVPLYPVGASPTVGGTRRCHPAGGSTVYLLHARGFVHIRYFMGVGLVAHAFREQRDQLPRKPGRVQVLALAPALAPTPTRKYGYFCSVP